MTQLVEALLNLAKIESDVDQLARSVDIGQLVESVAAAYRPRAEGKALLYNVEVEGGLPVVIGDPTLLRQAVSNLIDNAVQYTYTGSVTVRAQAGDDNHVVVEVQDTGPGISRADQVRLFERFYRVKRRESLVSKGTGLGLAIVRSIIERRHGGRVWVKSRLGVGSSFFIVLPGHSADVVGDAIASMRGNGGPAAPPSADPD
jgi:signal transduction histidine kinase